MPKGYTDAWKAVVSALSKRDPQHIVVISLFLGFGFVAGVSQSTSVTLVAGAVAITFLCIYLRWSVGEARNKERLAERALDRSEAAAADKRERQRQRIVSLQNTTKATNLSLTSQGADAQPEVRQLGDRKLGVTVRARRQGHGNSDPGE